MGWTTIPLSCFYLGTTDLIGLKHAENQCALWKALNVFAQDPPDVMTAELAQMRPSLPGHWVTRDIQGHKSNVRHDHHEDSADSALSLHLQNTTKRTRLALSSVTVAYFAAYVAALHTGLLCICGIMRHLMPEKQHFEVLFTECIETRLLRLF